MCSVVFLDKGMYGMCCVAGTAVATAPSCKQTWPLLLEPKGQEEEEDGREGGWVEGDAPLVS